MILVRKISTFQVNVSCKINYGRNFRLNTTQANNSNNNMIYYNWLDFKNLPQNNVCYMYIYIYIKLWRHTRRIQFSFWKKSKYDWRILLRKLHLDDDLSHLIHMREYYKMHSLKGCSNYYYCSCLNGYPLLQRLPYSNYGLTGETVWKLAYFSCSANVVELDCLYCCYREESSFDQTLRVLVLQSIRRSIAHAVLANLCRTWKVSL